jgi:acyl transferase domain-containing protein
MDPQQRILLTCAAEALDDANLRDVRNSKLKIGVFTGTSLPEYHLANLRRSIDVNTMSPRLAGGGALSSSAAHIAVSLGLNGPALSVDTACSTSLTATHVAIQMLRERQCDLAVVGACNLILSPFTTAALDAASLLSTNGLNTPLGADGDGYVRGEGCGVLILARHQDVRDSSGHIYSLIRSSSIYQHGRRARVSTVSAVAQITAIRESLARAELLPHEIQFVEAQANGSADAATIEIESIAEAYERQQADDPPLFVGSCKANLGYLEHASGMASIIKVALSLYQAQIPGQPGLTDPHPSFAGRPALRASLELSEWPQSAKNMAGVSAFGFTGTNAHLIMEGLTNPAREARPSLPALRSALAGSRARSFWSDGNVWT